jgi:hypothetical protein
MVCQKQRAEHRKNAINRYCWSSEANWYVDCDSKGEPNHQLTLAGVAALFFRVAPPERAKSAVNVIKEKSCFDSEVPARRSHGGEAAEAFHLVIPSRPGFGFSGPNVLLGWRSRGEREQSLPQ